MPNPIEVRFLGLNLTSEVGADDCLVAVPVVPAGRDGTKIYARALGPDETYHGAVLTYDPSAGEEIHFRPGSLQITIQDVDHMAKPAPDGDGLARCPSPCSL
jgi:hypothetical protein